MGVVFRQALADPYAEDITLRPRFLALPHTQLTINDMHFSQRDRNGRLLAFMARAAQRPEPRVAVVNENVSTHEGGGALLAEDVNVDAASYPTVYGVGVDQATALLVYPNGTSSIVGSGSSFQLKLDGDTPRKCVEGAPLSIARVEAYCIDAAYADTSSFDFATWRGVGGLNYSYAVVNGSYVGSPYGPSCRSM